MMTFSGFDPFTTPIKSLFKVVIATGPIKELYNPACMIPEIVIDGPCCANAPFCK